MVAAPGSMTMSSLRAAAAVGTVDMAAMSIRAVSAARRTPAGAQSTSEASGGFAAGSDFDLGNVLAKSSPARSMPWTSPSVNLP
jgi:hypothetical protein